MIASILFIVMGLVCLYYGGDWLVEGASRMALSFAVSPLMIGLTIVALGTSAPELLVSVQSAFQGISGLALGNVIGSNIANIGLILGITGIISPIGVKETLVRREIPTMIIVTIFASLLILDGTLSRLDGILLLFGFILFNAFFYYLAQNEPIEEELETDDHDEIQVKHELARILLGIVVLVIGSKLLIIGAVDVARSLGISELIIGLTMVAFGTSLPELAASLTAALKGESDIAMGNIIGSNIANLLLVLGTTAFITPFEVHGELGFVEFITMIGFSVLLLPFARHRVLSRRESALFLGAYFAFIIYSFFFAG